MKPTIQQCLTLASTHTVHIANNPLDSYALVHVYCYNFVALFAFQVCAIEGVCAEQINTKMSPYAK